MTIFRFRTQLILLAVLLYCGSLHAQRYNKKTTPAERAQITLDRYSDVLKLDSIQIKEVYKIYLTKNEQSDKIRAQYDPIRSEMHAKLDSIPIQFSPQHRRKLSKEIRAEYKSRLKPMKAELKSNQALYDKKMKGLLNEEQLAELKRFDQYSSQPVSRPQNSGSPE